MRLFTSRHLHRQAERQTDRQTRSRLYIRPSVRPQQGGRGYSPVANVFVPLVPSQEVSSPLNDPRH